MRAAPAARRRDEPDALQVAVDLRGQRLGERNRKVRRVLLDDETVDDGIADRQKGAYFLVEVQDMHFVVALREPSVQLFEW